ncbi:MAG: hypothetical protein QOE37_1714 [Microbacteriaceae bacterium]|jgi:hypothetical protein|nr:hypothetical protein [Microbacteriaceae bacterium]
MQITAVSKRLGHASSAITSDLYSHLLDDIDLQMADAIEDVLDGTAPRLHTHRTQDADSVAGAAGEDCEE